MRLALIINAAAAAADTHPDPHRHTDTHKACEALSVHMWVFKGKNFQSFLTGPFFKMVAMVKKCDKNRLQGLGLFLIIVPEPFFSEFLCNNL